MGYLVPFDGSFEASDLYKNISMTTIKDISKRIPAKHIFYVMDSCYSGLLVATRGADESRKTSRDFAYLQEITKEDVRQVLTAGGKDQEVLDGGPMGHSVFTGRFIEVLENTDDFVTASEVSTFVKEKVFSDARSRDHVQTPKSGELYGTGDYVFVPSLERKVEDTQAALAKLEKEKKRLEKLEKAALKAKDEMAQRQAELERRAVEAKLKAEQLKQERLAAEKKKRAQEVEARKVREAQLKRQKQEADERLASLRKEVLEKRQAMDGTTLSSLSPEKTLTEMQQIDVKIKEIRKQFRTELKNGIYQIVQRYNTSFLKLADQKKDEFETEAEFKARKSREMGKLNTEQAGEFTAFQDRLGKEYNQQIAPFIDQLKKLSAHDFTLRAENLILELGVYDGALNAYPVSIRAKQPIKGILVASNAKIPIPREEAREFKLHFQNNMLRPEIIGNFQTPDVFMISQAYVIDDATTKQYNLFSARLVDLGNGTLYDTKSKLIWSKQGSTEYISHYSAVDYIKRLNNDAYLGFRDWRLPTREELRTLVSYAKSAGYGTAGKTIVYFLNREGFTKLFTDSYYWTSTLSGSRSAWGIYFSDGKEATHRFNTNLYVLAVRSGR